MSGRIKHQDIFVALAKTGLTQHFEYRSPIEYDSSRRLEQFVEIIAAKAAVAEREACAAFLETGVDMKGLAGDPVWTKYTFELLTGCAAAIRARWNNER